MPSSTSARSGRKPTDINITNKTKQKNSQWKENENSWNFGLTLKIIFKITFDKESMTNKTGAVERGRETEH